MLNVPPHISNHCQLFEPVITGSNLFFRASGSQLRLSFHPSHLPLAYVITAAVPRRRRDVGASAVGRRAGSLSRDRNLRAGSGPRFPHPAHLISISLCLCFATFFCPR